jgi:hypothetical protein
LCCHYGISQTEYKKNYIKNRKLYSLIAVVAEMSKINEVASDKGLHDSLFYGGRQKGGAGEGEREKERRKKRKFRDITCPFFKYPLMIMALIHS